jgi:hypothetical protein
MTRGRISCMGDIDVACSHPESRCPTRLDAALGTIAQPDGQ